MANQAEQVCIRTARKAGYEAGCAVYLQMDGSVDCIRLSLSRGGTPPVMDEEMLTGALAQLLSIPPEKISWQPLRKEATP